MLRLAIHNKLISQNISSLGTNFTRNLFSTRRTVTARSIWTIGHLQCNHIGRNLSYLGRRCICSVARYDDDSWGKIIQRWNVSFIHIVRCQLHLLLLLCLAFRDIHEATMLQRMLKPNALIVASLATQFFWPEKASEIPHSALMTRPGIVFATATLFWTFLVSLTVSYYPYRGCPRDSILLPRLLRMSG